MRDRCIAPLAIRRGSGGRGQIKSGYGLCDVLYAARIACWHSSHGTLFGGTLTKYSPSDCRSVQTTETKPSTPARILNPDNLTLPHRTTVAEALKARASFDALMTTFETMPRAASSVMSLVLLLPRPRAGMFAFLQRTMHFLRVEERRFRALRTSLASVSGDLTSLSRLLKQREEGRSLAR